MSNVSEIVEMYRDDIEVGDELFGRMILDAHARDQEAAVSGVGGSIFPPISEQMTPEEAARYLLIQYRKVVETIETIGEAIEGLNALDDKREKRLDGLADVIAYLERRVDLRAEEHTALSKRIENVTRIVSSNHLHAVEGDDA